MTLLFALSIANPASACTHSGRTLDTGHRDVSKHAAHHVASSSVQHAAVHDMSQGSHSGQQSLSGSPDNTSPDRPAGTRPHGAPAGCTVLMSCSASVGVVRLQVIEAPTVTRGAERPVGPVLRDSAAEREVEPPPPRR